MKFLLSIYGNDEIWNAAYDWPAIIAATDAHNKEMVDAGELLFAGGVGEPPTTRLVRRGAGGEAVVTDGPYIEAKEYLGSFYIVDCESIERAIELAAAMPSAEFREIEVWPILHGGTAEDL